jgi:uncharacterized small protein (DUF1192 family)
MAHTVNENAKQINLLGIEIERLKKDISLMQGQIAGIKMQLGKQKGKKTIETASVDEQGEKIKKG